MIDYFLDLPGWAKLLVGFVLLAAVMAVVIRRDVSDDETDASE